jgi:hypothetical protein
MAAIYSTNPRDHDADVAEARRLLAIIDEEVTKRDTCLSNWEATFLESITTQLDEKEWLSEKQLFRLRELKDRLI